MKVSKGINDIIITKELSVEDDELLFFISDDNERNMKIIDPNLESRVKTIVIDNDGLYKDTKFRNTMIIDFKNNFYYEPFIDMYSQNDIILLIEYLTISFKYKTTFDAELFLKNLKLYLNLILMYLSITKKSSLANLNSIATLIANNRIIKKESNIRLFENIDDKIFNEFYDKFKNIPQRLQFEIETQIAKNINGLGNLEIFKPNAKYLSLNDILSTNKNVIIIPPKTDINSSFKICDLLMCQLLDRANSKDKRIKTNLNIFCIHFDSYKHNLLVDDYLYKIPENVTIFMFISDLYNIVKNIGPTLKEKFAFLETFFYISTQNKKVQDAFVYEIPKNILLDKNKIFLFTKFYEDEDKFNFKIVEENLYSQNNEFNDINKLMHDLSNNLSTKRKKNTKFNI